MPIDTDNRFEVRWNRQTGGFEVRRSERWQAVTPASSPGPATVLTETSGPTDLAIGAIADGEYLRRVGATVVGGTPSGGGGAVDAPLISLFWGR